MQKLGSSFDALVDDISGAFVGGSPMDKFEARVHSAIERIKQTNDNNVDLYAENALRRNIFSELELTKLDIEEYVLSSGNEIYRERASALYQMIDDAGRKIPIIKFQPVRSWYAYFDVAYRLFGFYLVLLNSGVFLAIPAIIARIIEKTCGIPARYSVCEFLRKCMAGAPYVVTAVECHHLGFESKYFDSSSSLLTYTHSCTLDPFFVGPYVPNRIIIVAKKEIYLIPFLSWAMLATGGIAVDRSNHARAIAAMQRSAASAKDEHMCVFIAPEGTRSPDGQLLPFKKGPFHVWEQLQSPIIPIVIHGAHELWAKKKWLNNPGKACIQCLPPIMPSEVTSRDHMMRTLRRRNLEALAECPMELRGPISWRTRANSLLLFFFMVTMDVVLVYLIQYLLLSDSMLGLSVSSAVLSLVVLVIFITLVLYAYAVYCAGTCTKMRHSPCGLRSRLAKVESGECEVQEASADLGAAASAVDREEAGLGFSLGEKQSIRGNGTGRTYHSLHSSDPDTH
jgi:1-acyl-sn-glycerol-3-phosphate acyltransferase